MSEIREFDLTEDFFNYCKNKVSNFELTNNTDEIDGEAKTRKLKHYMGMEFDEKYNTDCDFKERTLSSIYYELLLEFLDRSKRENGDYLCTNYLVYIEKLWRLPLIYDSASFTPRLSLIIKYKFKKTK